ncbi:MAG: ATP-binding protein [Patescibacteria group bacterium]
MTPSIYSIAPFISAVLFLYLGLFVFSKNWKSLTHTTFFFVCLVTTIWEFSWSILFNIADPTAAMFIVRIGYTGVIFIPISLYNFFFTFLKPQQKFYRILLFFFYALSFFFIAMLWSGTYFVSGIYNYFWGFYPKAGILHPFYMGILIFFLTAIFFYMVYSVFRSTPKENHIRREQIKTTLWAFIFYFFASFDFVANYGFEFYPIGFIFILIFLSIIGYSIVRQKLFNIRAIVAELLMLSLIMVLGLRLFFVEFLRGTFFDVLLFVGVFIVGIFLVRSVRREIKQKERLDIANKALTDLNLHLEEKVAEQTVEIRKSYEVEKRARIELEELDKAKDQFILNSQHHLRTPLTVMKGFVQAALDKKEGLDKETKGYLAKAMEASERMTSLLNDLLGVSQFEVGKAVLTPESVDLYDVLDEIHKELASEIEVKHLSFTLSFTPQASSARVVADRKVIKAALYNFVDNAVKYTEKGSIAVAGEVVVHPIEKMKFLKISIKDSGIGISAEDLSSMFNRYFERGEEAQKVYTTGKGIGLALSRNMVRLHGGKVSVDSGGIGKGSTFIVELPLPV